MTPLTASSHGLEAEQASPCAAGIPRGHKSATWQPAAIQAERGCPLALRAADGKSGRPLGQGTTELPPAAMGTQQWIQASGFPGTQMAQNHRVSEGGEQALFLRYFKGQIPVFTVI